MAVVLSSAPPSAVSQPAPSGRAAAVSWAATLLAFSLCWFVSVSSVAVGVLALALLLHLRWHGPAVRHHPGRWLVLWCVLFIAWHVASVAWSDDLATSWWELRKMSVIAVLPLLFLLQRRSGSTRDIVRILSGGTLLGLVSALAYCLAVNVQEYRETARTDVFFSHALTLPVRAFATDFGRFTYLLTLYLAWMLYHKWAVWGRGRRWAVAGLLLALQALQLVLGSKLVLAVHLLMLMVLSFYLLYRAGRRRLAVLLPSTLALGFVLLVVAIPDVRERFVRVLKIEDNLLAAERYDPRRSDYDELNIRLIFWKNGWTLIREQPWFGTGIGDAVAVSQRRLDQRGLVKQFSGMNLHNQFLHTWLSTGLVGLLLFVGVLGSFLQFAWRQRNVLALGVAVLLAANSFFDSTLLLYNSALFFVFTMGWLVWTAPQAGFFRWDAHPPGAPGVRPR